MAERQTINPNQPAPELPGWAEPIYELGAKLVNNIVPIGIGTLVILACLGIAGLIQVSRVAAEREAVTTFANALFEEDEAERAAALEAAGQAEGAWGVEAAYLAGEAALAKSEWDKARASFEKIVNEHADSPLAPRAAEGLAFIDEANGAFEQALEGYQKVSTNWPDSFAARCQPYNIGRVQETLGQMRYAVDSYKNQSVVFKDSKIAADAETALERLRISHPDLFTDEAAATDPAAAPEAAAPAEAAPAEAAPAESAPVVDGAAAPAPEAAAATVEIPATEPAQESTAPENTPAQQ